MGKNPYVIGGDTAGVGEDYFTAKVINNITKKTAAVLWKQRLDEAYAQLFRKYYRSYRNRGSTTQHSLLGELEVTLSQSIYKGKNGHDNEWHCKGVGL